MTANPILTIMTATGSYYEIDPRWSDDLLGYPVRRVYGENPPTEYQGPEGEWKVSLEPVKINMGKPMTFVWAYEGSTAKVTVTSPIKKIL